MGIYRHTQFGTATVVMVAIAFVIPLAMLSNQDTVWPAVAVSALLLLVGVFFGTLEVSVDRSDVRCRFGIGLIRKRIPLRSISGVRVVRNKWYYGYGIRLTPTGWMWNVSGLSAVLLTLDEGRTFRIGTDEPHRLARAITEAAGLPVDG